MRELIVCTLYSYILSIVFMFIYRLIYLSNALPTVGIWPVTNEYKHEEIFQY
jgi:ABC-type multidrug transport system permease subunit